MTTPVLEHTESSVISQADFQALLRDKVCLAVRLMLNTVLDLEVEAFIGAAPYERTPTRQDYRNGRYERGLVTGVGPVTLTVPRTRKGFTSLVFERYCRRQAELNQAIGEMFVKGASTAQVGEIVETLTGVKPSPSAVSRVHQTLQAEFDAWKQRPLLTHYLYLFADGTYFTVIYDAEGHKMPVLAVIGITPTGTREVLAFVTGDRENEQAWTDLLTDLQQRGLRSVGLWISDGNQAMLKALAAKFPETPRQRCVKHKLANVLGYIPKMQHAAVEPELKAIFYQPNRQKADQAWTAFCEKYTAIYPSAVECLKRDGEACLTFYAFPATHWKTIRTSNVIERLFEEVKKRTHKMSAAFRNEGSCLLMFYAVIRSLKFRRIAVETKA
jgi:transposase-like protein